MSEDFSRLRQEAGLSRREAAERFGYSLRTIYRWENGESLPRKAALEYLTTVVGEKERPANRFTFIDLFAGIGGMRRGFDTVGGRCVFSSEWDRFCQETYRANFDCEHDIAGDITAIPAADIPEHDVLLAGFPCQPFSIAGVSKKNALGREHGFRCDAQGTLFFDVARIIEQHKPRAFLLENVKNLVSHDQGRTFAVIHHTLTEELGYHISWRVLDARRFVPQHRERIFIVGLRDYDGFTLADIDLPSPDDAQCLKTVLHPEDGSEEPEPAYTDNAGRVLSKYTLSDHLWTYLKGYAEKHRRKGNGFGFGLVGPEDVARTLSARYYKDGSEVLIRQSDRNPRRLTPRECARLMGFESRRTVPFRIPVSDTQAYKQFGNAVVVPVVEAIARHLAPWIRHGDVQERRAVA
ncbi:MAG: DNA (cytosine-5-)-methyltransferase [Gammaproteobacteria bacterium]|nr:DNA (cytosine-5-)-methyltransferase [Gammaproteobacteria bacterium]